MTSREPRSMKHRAARTLAFAVGMLQCLALPVIGDAEAQREYNPIETTGATGSVTVVALGDDHLSLTFDQQGVAFEDSAKGPFHNLSHRCVGFGHFVKGVGRYTGSCVHTDPEGDQYFEEFRSVEHRLGDRSFTGTSIFPAGKGKFAGMTGTCDWTSFGGSVRPTGTNAYQAYSKWTCKLLLP